MNVKMTHCKAKTVQILNQTKVIKYGEWRCSTVSTGIKTLFKCK